MKIKLEVINPDEKIPEKDRQSLTVETHGRRGDTFIVMSAKTIIEGSAAQEITIPTGGRLVITTPNNERELVIDREQNAVIRPANQQNDEGRADSAQGAKPPAPQSTLTPPPQRTAPTNPQPRTQTTQAPPAAGGTRTTPPPPNARANTSTPSTAPAKSEGVAGSETGKGTLDTRNTGGTT